METSTVPLYPLALQAQLPDIKRMANFENTSELPLEWKIDDFPVNYPAALRFMDERVSQIVRGLVGECVWLLEHPPLYTAGTSANVRDLLAPERFPVFQTGRGGEYTYHGPGQRIAYTMLDLSVRGKDLRKYVWLLEEWIIQCLDDFGVQGERREGRVGIWVHRAGGRDDKIAAIGVRVRKWITLHGFSLNVDPNLGHFSGIVPCGLSSFGVTSLADLGLIVSRSEVDCALRRSFRSVFGN